MARNMTDKVRDDFGYDNIEVMTSEIRVYYMRDNRGVEWVPANGGPLYRQHAIESAAWLARHVEEYRSLLPKSIRAFPVVFGELNTSMFPGNFYPTRLPAKKAE